MLGIKPQHPGQKTYFCCMLTLKKKSHLTPEQRYAIEMMSRIGKKQSKIAMTIAEKLGADFYFAHSYSSWGRGLNEYTNKFIRQYIPKNSRLKIITTDISKKYNIKSTEDPEKNQVSFLQKNCFSFLWRKKLHW